MAVPLLDVNAQNEPLKEELRSAFDRVLEHGQFIMGPEVKRLEEEIAGMLDVSHAIAVSSGTDALLLSFMALGLGPGDEVLCPAFTFFATAGAIARTGATPVFVDSCPVCFNIDTNDARSKLTDRSKAIVPVHLFGQSADMQAVMKLAEEHQLRVVEDGAQAIGSKHRGRHCGTIGDFGTFSFFPSKNLGGFGDGGMVVTNDPDLAEMATIMRVHGGKPKYYHSVIGGNFRCDTMQAALISVKLACYDDFTSARRKNAAYYTEQLSALEGVVVADPAHCRCAEGQDARLANDGARLVLPATYEHNEHIWNQYTLRVLGEGKRDQLRQHLSDLRIGSEIYYPVTMDRQACFAHLPESSRTGCTTAHRLAGEVLSIPIYPELSREQQDEVIAAISQFL